MYWDNKEIHYTCATFITKQLITANKDYATLHHCKKSLFFFSFSRYLFELNNVIGFWLEISVVDKLGWRIIAKMLLSNNPEDFNETKN